MRKYLLLIGVLLIQGLVQAQTPEIWSEFLEDRANGQASTLLDFSFAGYNFSRTEIPNTSSWEVFDVTDFGAIANDENYDDEGIQAAIDAAEAFSGNAMVFFPAGRFIVSSNNDATKEIMIHGSNIVLKGSGSGNGGTEIYMDKYRAANGHWQFHFIPAEEELNTSPITIIDGAVAKGSYSVNVVDASNLTEGQVIHITHKSEEFARAHFGDLELSTEWTRLFGAEGGMNMYEPHIIKKIEGNKVTFDNPVQTGLPVLSTPFTIRQLATISEVGVEDILFTSGWDTYGETFVHHKDDIHDYGWSALQFEYVQNAWLRNCEFKSWSEVVDVRQSIAVTIENVTISGEKGHASFLTRRSYGLLVKDCIDNSAQHHGPGTGYAGVNTVYLRCAMQEDQSVDSHSGQPYATLIDDVQGGVFNRNGGPHESYPHHGRDMVFWNFRHTASDFINYNFWPNNRNGNTYAEPYFIGFQPNNEVAFENEGINVMEGSMVEPRSLFEAQLSLRLNDEQGSPVVRFVSPTAGANLDKGGNMIVEIDATDPNGTISQVVLSVNGKALRTIDTEPYTWGQSETIDPELYNLNAGTYNLTATATDNDGRTSNSEIEVNVGAKPIVSIIRPEPTKIIEDGDNVEVEVTASDADGSISKIDLYINEQFVGSRANSPYIWGTSSSEDPLLFDLKAQSYTLEVVAIDDDGLTSRDIQSVVVNSPPIISFSTPESGVELEEGANVQVNIGAADTDGTITEVKLYINGEFLRTDRSVPYTWGFDESKDPELFNMLAGSYWLRGEARDNRSSKTSDSLLVIINEPPLTISQNVVEDYKVYPNPFINSIFIRTSSKNLNSIVLRDLHGKIIPIKTALSSNSINIVPLKNLNSGLYILEYFNGNIRSSIKILKQ